MDPTDGLKVHKRHIPVETARRELGSFLIDLKIKHGLTSAEYTALLAEAMSSFAHLLVRHERRDDG